MGINEQNLTAPAQIHGFNLELVQPIAELHSTAYLFSHIKTGARLIHLYNDDPNNLFCVAFRTPVSDSTGVPHILEHSVLCGSQKFPLKDPFQELLKGSLQTFLNALTYPDKTVYPVSSQVEKDFFNLVDVYCDAVFNPKLTRNTFYQEGWHFDVEDPSKPVNIKGIVYNEMKGVFSNFSSHVERKTLSALFPDNTYYYESGGEPEHITDLTFEQFKAFHSRYYHPSNSFTFLYGNIPSEKTLQFLNENYLHNFSKISIDSMVKPQPLWDKPRSLSIEAPGPQEDNGSSTVALVWIFGESADPVTTLAGKILSHYLLGTESSPLKRALIDSGLGEDLDDISGFDSDLVQSVFAAGLRKSKPEYSHQVEKLILETLRDQITCGLDSELLEGALRQVEFSLREITGGHFPHNLKLAERCYRSWIYGGDPLAHLAFEKPLSYIKEQHATNPNFFTDLIRFRIIENPHRLLSTITASSEMGEKLAQQTEKKAAEMASQFGEPEKQHYYELTQTLLEQQKKPPSTEELASIPKLHKSDLPSHGHDVPTEIIELDGVTLYTHPLFTSGIVYFDIGFDLRSVPQDLIPYLPIYTELLTRCGAAGLSYEQTARRIALSTGGVDSSVACKTMLGTENDLFFYSFFHSKSLVPRFGELLNIVKDLFLAPELENRKQIKDILLEERNSLHSSIISAGHHFALNNASSFLSRSKFIDEQLGGISQLRFLDKLIKNDSAEQITESIRKLHSIIINKNSCVVSITADKPPEIIDQVKDFLGSLPRQNISQAQYQTNMNPPQKIKCIEINSAVNFVAQTWKLSPVLADRAGRLFLISRNLSTGYLWDKVRVEGGAYGGMSLMSISNPVFACASYRDPNLVSTLGHFESGLKEIVSVIAQDRVDQSIIGSIGKIDAPHPPHSQGLGETIDQLMGYSKELKQELREAILNADSDSLKDTALEILQSQPSVVVVLGGGPAFDVAEKQGLQIEREQLI